VRDAYDKPSKSLFEDIGCNDSYVKGLMKFGGEIAITQMEFELMS
jgi:hypothetical protein